MKNLFLFLVLCPLLIFGNNGKIPSKIKSVTVYLSGASITRSAKCDLPSGSSEITFTGLSTKIDESSIQISGLEAVSILSMSYDINYLVKQDTSGRSILLKDDIEAKESQIAFLKNKIAGLEEEEQIIHTNRAISNRLQSFDLEKIKKVSTYYRERITQIKDEIFKTNQKINQLSTDIRRIQKQMAEINTAPQKEQGELKINFDAPVDSSLNLIISYQVKDAGWIPNYDIKSNDINAPLFLSYKAHVYQKTGTDWNDVNITLSTGNPTINVEKPDLGSKYLNFTNGYQKMNRSVTKKKRYVYNPSVKTVTGTVLDESGAPLPGASIIVKGTSNGTQTDFDGHFSLEVENGQELSVSYVGYNNTVLPIYSSVMNIRLDEDMLDLQNLDEVVVTAQGIRRESKALGYAVRSVDPEKVLRGKVAGLESQNARRSGSSNATPIKKPLYVVDGVPIADFANGDLDMDEIQSIEVLKGANATSLYGNHTADKVIVITTKKSATQDDVTNTKFIIKKPYSIVSDGDITAIEINTFKLDAEYEYFAAPIINENVFLTTAFNNWEQYNLLPGEASVYFKGTYAGKTTIDPYTTKKEMIVSLGIDPNITVTRKQDKNFKSKSFMGNSRILDRTYDLEVKNNKEVAIDLKMVDRIPISQNKEIKVDDVATHNADYNAKKGLLTWKLQLAPKAVKTERFSFQVKYPKYKRVTL